jgi:glycosyltransferase involved in cell wall biosynthesis
LVYWAGDWLYLPVRPFFAYANIRSNIQSLLFLLFDAVTCKLSDRVWDTTERISRARKGICPWVLKSGKERTLSPLFIHRSCRINRTPDCFHFVHFGVLTEDRQPSLLLRAISQIIHLGHRVHLHLIGFSIDRNEDMLSNLGATLGITEHVTFHGFIEEFDQIDSMLQQYDCGLALAVPSCHLHSYFAWTSKIAYYLSMGVPVVTTRHSSELAVWIEKYHAGCVVDNSLESLVDAMLQVMESYRTGFPRIVDQNINLLIDAVDSVNSFNEVLMDLARTNAFSGGESR